MHSNYCVIMAGGAGTRFWPLSRLGYPKQFIDVLGLGKTFLQMTSERFLQFILPENMYVVTNVVYVDIVKEQLPYLTDEQILLEPVGRNTAPCIAYACYKIQSKDPDANIVVAPSDHLIMENDKFKDCLEQALAFTKKQDCLLTLGIVPTRPETGYGYVQYSCEMCEDELIVPVKTFTEKPDKELAQVFIDSGDFLWNTGIFLWKGAVITKAFETYLPDMAEAFSEGQEVYYTEKEQDFINKVFVASRSISIDYGILEKAENVFTLRASFGWTDLGTWGRLHEECEEDKYGNTYNNEQQVSLYECEQNTIYVHEGAHAVLQGLKGFVVVKTKDALLVCKRDQEQRIKEFVADLKLTEKKHLL